MARTISREGPGIRKWDQHHRITHYFRWHSILIDCWLIIFIVSSRCRLSVIVNVRFSLRVVLRIFVFRFFFRFSRFSFLSDVFLVFCLNEMVCLFMRTAQTASLRHRSRLLSDGVSSSFSSCFSLCPRGSRNGRKCQRRFCKPTMNETTTMDNDPETPLQAEAPLNNKQGAKRKPCGARFNWKNRTKVS